MLNNRYDETTLLYGNDRDDQKLLNSEIKKTSFPEKVFLEASEYLELFYREHQLSESQFSKRLSQVKEELWETGTYHQTKEELIFGAKVAWRNSVRCIGRLFWEELIVRDLRHLETAEEIFIACIEHIQLATNQGKIRSVISIFAPDRPEKSGVHIINQQLIRYAGYRQDDGRIIGDPAQAELTEIIQQFGWSKKDKTEFDLLPLIVKAPAAKPQMFELPREIVLEVPLSHPEYGWVNDSGLKWHAVPIVADKVLSVGGISYPAAPFNGWYMNTEIARNLGDSDRYNVLPYFAQKMGLNTKSNISLWKDRALLELNVAILYSFAQQGVSIVDHHTASRQFIRHLERERHNGRIVPADWGWIVPPLSGSTTEVFHRESLNICMKPNFFDRPQLLYFETERKGCPFHS